LPAFFQVVAPFFLSQRAVAIKMRKVHVVGVQNRALPACAAPAAADQARGIKGASSALRALWTEGTL